MAVRIVGEKRAGVGAGWAAALARRAAKALGRSDDDLSVVFLTPPAIKKLNAAYRRKNKTTDTLSFPADAPGDLGDVFIAPSVAKTRAKERGAEYRDYLALLIVHGVLHLGGHDHHTAKESRIMGKMEEKILK